MDSMCVTSNLTHKILYIYVNKPPYIMKKIISYCFMLSIAFLLVSCGEEETSTIVWYNKEKGIKKMEKKHENGNLIITYYYTNGKKSKERIYKNGKQQGENIAWYLNGNIKTHREFDDGKKTGCHKHFFENGELSYVEYFKDGFKEGTFSFYFPNGEIWREEVYKAGAISSIKDIFFQ